MQSNVFFLSSAPRIERAESIPLVDGSLGWKEAIVLWTHLTEEGIPQNPLCLIRRIHLVHSLTIIVACDRAYKEPFLFVGNKIGRHQKAVADAIVREGIGAKPKARRFVFTSGVRIRALTLSFAETVGVELIIFED